MIVEFTKLIKDKQTYVGFFCLLIIIIGGVITGINDYYENETLYKGLFGNNPDVLVFHSPHQYWIGLSVSNFFSSFYYFIFPLLVSIPMVDTIYREKNGYISYELTRRKRYIYFSSKFIFTFFTAFIFFILPLLIGMFLINLITGHWDYSGYSSRYVDLVNGTAILPDDTFTGQKREIFSGLMAQSPYLYILCYYIIGGLYASLYVCFGLSLSLFLKNRYIILFGPLLLYLGFWFLFTFIGQLSWDPFNFLVPNQPIDGLFYFPFIFNFIFLLLIVLVLYIIGVKKNIDILP